MSLDTYLGRRGNILAEGEEHALVHVPSPVLLDDEMAPDALEFGAMVLPITFDAAARGGSKRPRRSFGRARQAVDWGDPAHPERPRGGEGWAPSPPCWPPGRCTTTSIREGKRMRADLIVQTGEALGHPPPGLPHRLRRRGGAPLPGPGLRRAFAGQRASRPPGDGAGGALPEGRGQGPVPDHVQDGHLRRIVLPRGADLRGRGRQPGLGSTAALAGPFAHRGHRLLRCPRKPCAATTTPTARRSPWAPACPTWALSATRRTASSDGYNRLAVVAMQKASRSGEYADYRAYRELVHGGACGSCGTSSTLCPWARPSRWTRWSRPRRSSASLLNPGHVPGGLSRPRPTPPWRWA